MKRIICIAFLLLNSILLMSQNTDSLFIKSIFSNALSSSASYENLRYLCKNIGGRIGGSTQAAKADDWVKIALKEAGADTVFIQEIKVRNWKRGDKEYCYSKSNLKGKYPYNVCALGGSVGTEKKGIFANVIEVQNFEQLKQLGETQIKGKIVFFNRPADQTLYNTFAAYGGAANQRVFGASMAASYGAVASISRSLTVVNHIYPHTGIMHYLDSLPKIPAFAISTIDADLLSKLLKIEPSAKVFLRSNCYEKPDTTSENVIAEIKGSEYPNEIIVVGAHVDSWELGEGAHDDGIGVVQAMDVIRIFKELNIKPKHTIRVVEFMDEEMAQRGGRKYAEIVMNSNEKHIAAIESDEGGFTPQGFSYDAGDNVTKRLEQWKPLLENYGLWLYHKGYSGVDISFMENQNIPLFGLITDSQLYFDYQHAATDKFETVNQRQLQLGGASMAALIYLIDKYGF
ncbi:MAG: M20/M25/M40 family metallo-hydrolase [Bacteroidota bacterium]